MLERDALHSLNASLMQAERSSAKGLNSASAVLGNARTAKPRAAITVLRIVSCATVWRTRGRTTMMAITKSRFAWNRSACQNRKKAPPSIL